MSRLGARRVCAGAVLRMLVAAALASSANATQAESAEPQWTTYHRDAGRSGNDPEIGEPVQPALDWQSPTLAGGTWGEPLVLGNRVYIATASDEIYALDASSGQVVWQQQAGTPVPVADLPCPGDVSPTVGFVGTPVIDPSTGSVYAVADIWNESSHEAAHVLEGYSLGDGTPLLSVPVDPPGADPAALLQRTALTLDEGNVVFGMGGNDGDCGQYDGTVVAVPEDGGAPRFWQYKPSSPAYGGGAVWGPSGPVMTGGDVYLADGNPNFPEGMPVSQYDYSDSFLRLDPASFVADPSSEPEAPLAWFEPPTWLEDSNDDSDLGSAGPELLPGGVLFQAGKKGTGYLLASTIEGAGAALYEGQVCKGARSFGGDAYAAGVIYVGCQNGVQALSYDGQAHTFAELWQGPPDAFGAPILAAGTVWSVATGGFKGGGTKLYGLDPASGAVRYSETLPSGVTDHFATPSAAGGLLFVATGASVTAYRIERAQPTAPSSSPAGSGPAPPSSWANAKAPSEPSTAAHGTAGRAKLARRRLRVGADGRLRIPLRCSPAGRICRGTITLRAEVPVSEASAQRTVTITLLHTRFGPGSGSFQLRRRLSTQARAHLSLHHNRLRLRVTIAGPDGIGRNTDALMT